MEILEETASRQQINLDIRLRLSSYPQLAASVVHLEMAAVMPILTTSSLPIDSIQAIWIPCMDKLSRQVSLIWNRKSADIRPKILTYSTILSTLFKSNA